jgi:hypothetical protein
LGDRDENGRAQWQTNVWCLEFGKEKMIPLKGLDDKAIESKITELVKAPIS